MERVGLRKFVAVVAPLGIGTLLWWMWDVAFSWPPADDGKRLAFSLAAGAAIAVALSVPLWDWAKGSQSDVAQSAEASRAASSASLSVGGSASNSTFVVGNSNTVTTGRDSAVDQPNSADSKKIPPGEESLPSLNEDQSP